MLLWVAQREGHVRTQPEAAVYKPGGSSHQTPSLLTPCSWISSFQDCEKRNLFQATQSVVFCYDGLS